MTAIAEKLDEVMRRLPPAAASSVEQRVWEVIHEAEGASPADAAREARINAHQAHWLKMDSMLAELDWSDFERPPQGEYEVREDW